MNGAVGDRRPVGGRRSSQRAALATAVVKAVVVVGALALFVVAGCGGAEPDEHGLDGTVWRLTGWPSSSIDPAEFTITAAFENGQVSGSSAVNSYSGPYTTGADDAFFVGDMASTMMAGPEPAMNAEQEYLTRLDGAATYKLVGGTLTLFDEFGDESLVFGAEE